MIEGLIPVCRLEELADPGARGFRVGEGEWPLRGIVVRVGNDVSAYVNRCPHAGHPLDLKPDTFLSPDRRHLICSSHGARFEPLSGHCVSGPCAGLSLRRIPVVVVAGEVRLCAEFRLADYLD
jgi:nitrite reductase/ring-hydroxylating ferredoxin subunit